MALSETKGQVLRVKGQVLCYLPAVGCSVLFAVLVFMAH